MRIKPAEHQQSAEPEDDEKCVMSSTLRLLTRFPVRLESKLTEAGYQQERKRQKVETEAKRFILVSHCVHQLIACAAQGGEENKACREPEKVYAK